MSVDVPRGVGRETPRATDITGNDGTSRHLRRGIE